VSKPIVCSVMRSVTRPYYHLRRLPKGGREAKGQTLCGLPVEQDYHFGLAAWGQPEMCPPERPGESGWCERCMQIHIHGALGIPKELVS